MKEGQEFKHSLVEQILNVGSGWLLSLFVWSFFITPLFDIQTDMSENTIITAIFTAISVVRGLLWRRLFNRIENRRHI